MKTITAILILAALPALAQDNAAEVDYSKDSLQRFVATIPPAEPERDRNFHFYLGGIEFRALGTRFNVLSPMLPFSGTRPTTNREMPDPFSLTGVSIATPFRAWRTQRTMEAELRRIERTERAKIRVRTM